MECTKLLAISDQLPPEEKKHKQHIQQASKTNNKKHDKTPKRKRLAGLEIAGETSTALSNSHVISFRI